MQYSQIISCCPNTDRTACVYPSLPLEFLPKEVRYKVYDRCNFLFEYTHLPKARSSL